MERGAEGEFGIENADFAPESDAGKRHRLRNAEIAPGRGLLSGWRVAVGPGSGKIDPAEPSGSALGIKMLDSNPGRALVVVFGGVVVGLGLDDFGVGVELAPAVFGELLHVADGVLLVHDFAAE